MLQLLVTKGALWTLCGGSCIGLALAILAEPLLLWCGRDYVAGASAMRILLIGQVIAAAGGSQLYVMTMTGHERKAAALLISSTAANCVVSAVLINLLGLGLIGAAISTATTIVAWNAIIAFFIWQDLHLVPGVVGGLRSSLVGK